MKALDTNVIVRFLVKDDLEQSMKVKSLLENAESNNERFHISLLVVLELIWVLKSVYKLDRSRIVDAIEEMSSMPVLEFEKSNMIQRFVSIGRKGDSELDDILVGLAAIGNRCSSTITFDKKALKCGLFERL